MKFRRSEAVLLLQAAAIILPVAALSGIALHFLHDDKAAVEQDARRAAQVIAPGLLRTFNDGLKRLADAGLAGAFEGGQPLAMPDYSRPPAPAVRPSPAAAEWHKLDASGRAGIVPRAIEVAHRYPLGVTESGTSVAALSLLLALGHTENGGMTPELAGEVESSATRYPSYLTPELLKAAAAAASGGRSADRIAKIQAAWNQQEAQREKTRSLVRQLAAPLRAAGGPTSIKLFGSTPPYLAICTPGPDGWRITFLADGDVVRLLQNLAQLPPFESLAVSVDQENYPRPAARGGRPGMVLNATGAVNILGTHRVFLQVLADPVLLYADHGNRLRLTQWLIFFAAATAMLGLASLWLGYRRQARLSEMKSNFVSSVSHELRAPLAAVRLMAESLEGGRVAEEDKRKDYYRLIVQECRRLSSLVENVLDLSRMSDGRKNYCFEPLDLTSLVQQSVALMEPCAAERQVTLRLTNDGAGEFQPAWDGHAVEQSLVNLLDNAIKHSPPGGEVCVAVERDSENIRLWVEDRGPGIPMREQKRIFELFQRHGSELRRETRGAGIGLTIVRSVAEAHGGRVIVQSEVGHGSRFGLELPLERPS